MAASFPFAPPASLAVPPIASAPPAPGASSPAPPPAAPPAPPAPPVASSIPLSIAPVAASAPKDKALSAPRRPEQALGEIDLDLDIQPGAASSLAAMVESLKPARPADSKKSGADATAHGAASSQDPKTTPMPAFPDTGGTPYGTSAPSGAATDRTPPQGRLDGAAPERTPPQGRLGGDTGIGTPLLARLTPKPVTGSAKPETRPQAILISPGVLPAIIRAWDFEWTGPMARARYRIFLGNHLELGRPARAAGGEGNLFVSLLPIGEDGKPSATLLSMLSRQALGIDLRADAAKITVMNKASVHISPDPLRPYWDWDNAMPGADRICPPGETIWISPHFGKVLAPISIKTISTAGQAEAACAIEMHFDALFFDLVAICIVMIDEDFELIWGVGPNAQLAPNVGEGPQLWLSVKATRQGMVVAPLNNGVWTRRQGKMMDDASLLLGGVSALRWDTDRGEISLKLTPHALPGPRTSTGFMTAPDATMIAPAPAPPKKP